jgi:hypothetical protein
MEFAAELGISLEYFFQFTALDSSRFSNSVWSRTKTYIRAELRRSDCLVMFHRLADRFARCRIPQSRCVIV